MIDPRIAEMGGADAGSEADTAAARRAAAVVDHLGGSGRIYTGRLLQHLEDRGELGTLLTPVARMLTDRRGATRIAPNERRFVDGFSWSRARVRSGGVSVPMAALDNALTVFRPAARERLANSITKTVLGSSWLSRWVTTKSVHVFIGTRVEAVAGVCVLNDLP